MTRVLVLRDREAAAETAQDLARRGFEPLVLPVQAIEPTDEAPPTGDFAGIVVTSRNAVPALRRHFAGTRRPVLAVGEATAAALRAAGFAHASAGPGEAASLVEPAARLGARAGRAVLLALGRRRTDALEDGLAKAGVPFALWETYETRLVRPSRAEVEQTLAGRPPDAVLVLSGSQAEGFGRLVADHPAAFRPRPRLLCLSARIAASLPAELRDAAAISPAPHLSALFERIAGTSLHSDCLAETDGGTRKTG